MQKMWTGADVREMWVDVGLPVFNVRLLVSNVYWYCHNGGARECSSTVDVRVRSLQNHGHKMDDFCELDFLKQMARWKMANGK